MYSMYHSDFKTYLEGSVKQNAAISSPTASFGRYFVFCSSVPTINIPLGEKLY